MSTRLISIAAIAFGTLVITSSGALAQRVPTFDIPTPEPCLNIRCLPPPVGEIPDPDGDPDPGNPLGGPETLRFALGCEVRDGGLVFRNLGDLTVATRTRLQWSTSDGNSGKLILGQPMEPKSAWLYAGAQVGPKADCVVTPA